MTIQRSSIPWPFVLSGRNLPVVNRSAAMVRPSAVTGIRNAGEAEAGASHRPMLAAQCWAPDPTWAVVEYTDGS
jgi:hypothetical protein